MIAPHSSPPSSGSRKVGSYDQSTRSSFLFCSNNSLFISLNSHFLLSLKSLWSLVSFHFRPHCSRYLQTKIMLRSFPLCLFSLSISISKSLPCTVLYVKSCIAFLLNVNIWTCSPCSSTCTNLSGFRRSSITISLLYILFSYSLSLDVSLKGTIDFWQRDFAYLLALKKWLIVLYERVEQRRRVSGVDRWWMMTLEGFAWRWRRGL